MKVSGSHVVFPFFQCKAIFHGFLSSDSVVILSAFDLGFFNFLNNQGNLLASLCICLCICNLKVIIIIIPITKSCFKTLICSVSIFY